MKQAYKLHVVQKGHGRPVILLHGMMSTHRYWNGVADLIKGQRHVFQPDLLGFGASPKPRRAAYSPEQMIACLEHTLKAYHFKEPPVLAGHSLGAMYALYWAVKRPEKFSAVVLSAPMFFEEALFHQQLATIIMEGKWLSSTVLARLAVFSMSLSGIVPTWLAIRLAPNYPRTVMEDVTSQRFFVFRKIMKHSYYRNDVLRDLRRLQIPSHILLGDQDLMASGAVDDLKALCKHSKSCSIQVVPGSHQVLLEHPEIVAQTILSV